MIIECKNCRKKFVVKDSDISVNGRTVQCSNCSNQWLQFPISSPVTTDNIPVTTDNIKTEKIPSKNKFTASDGKTYKFLGNQWAVLLPSGKTGRLAKKKISEELNNLAGKKHNKKKQTINKSKQFSNQYHEKNSSIGIFSFLIVLVTSVMAIILFLDTFKYQILPYWPNLENYLAYIFENLNNIYVIIKDLFNNYK